MVALDMQGEQPRKHISSSKKIINQTRWMPFAPNPLIFSLTRCWPHLHNQRLSVKQRRVKPGPFEKIQEKQGKKKKSSRCAEKTMTPEVKRGGKGAEKLERWFSFSSKHLCEATEHGG